MNLFQLVVLVPLSVLVAQTLRGVLRSQIRKRVAVLWLVLWVGSGVAVLWPRSTVIVARALGIGRGADLVLYLSVLLTLTGFFYIYTRFRRLDRQVTLLVRALAVDKPLLPKSGQDTPEGETLE